jgi:hypothetical protein
VTFLRAGVILFRPRPPTQGKTGPVRAEKKSQAEVQGCGPTCGTMYRRQEHLPDRLRRSRHRPRPNPPERVHHPGRSASGSLPCLPRTECLSDRAGARGARPRLGEPPAWPASRVWGVEGRPTARQRGWSLARRVGCRVRGRKGKQPGVTLFFQISKKERAPCP